MFRNKFIFYGEGLLAPRPGIIRIIQSRRKKWAGHVARIGGKQKRVKLLVGKPE
jgi:hypothetical protein